MTLADFDWTSRARPFFEIGVGDRRNPTAAARWDVALWDAATALWGGTEPTWLDVSCDVVSANIDIGRASTLDRFMAGRMEVVVDNTSGWLDSDVVSPASGNPAAFLDIRPGRQIRVGIDHTVYGRTLLFSGYIDELVPVYDPVQADWVSLNCIDAYGEVSRAKFIPDAAPGWDGEAASDRVQRLLNRANWPYVYRAIEPSGVLLGPTDSSGQMADLLGIIADSVGGAIFGSADGVVTFRNTGWMTYSAAAPRDGILGNIGPTDVCPTRWERPYRRSDIATRIILGRVGAKPLQWDDLEGQDMFGIEPFERTDLVSQTDSDLNILATRLLRTRNWKTAPKVKSVSYDAATADNVIDLLTTLSIYKPARYLCRLREPHGTVFEEDYFAVGIRHEITPDHWTADIDLDLAAPYVAPDTRWDTARWDVDRWSVAV